jgi:hypothetical protein
MSLTGEFYEPGRAWFRRLSSNDFRGIMIGIVGRPKALGLWVGRPIRYIHGLKLPALLSSSQK